MQDEWSGFLHNREKEVTLEDRWMHLSPSLKEWHWWHVNCDCCSNCGALALISNVIHWPEHNSEKRRIHTAIYRLLFIDEIILWHTLLFNTLIINWIYYWIVFCLFVFVFLLFARIVRVACVFWSKAFTSTQQLRLWEQKIIKLLSTRWGSIAAWLAHGISNGIGNILASI